MVQEIIIFWIFIGVFYGIIILSITVIEFRTKYLRKVRNEKVQSLKKVVERNKLKDTSTVSIDDMVKYLKESNISCKYVYKEE